MGTQQLFYENAVPVSQQQHGDLSVERVSYEFARNVNSVPLMAVEIPHAAREYTIVFVGEDEVIPVVLVGLEGNENLYVGEDENWSTNYVPAFVRRYPFVFAASPDGNTYTLCIDENWDGCNREGKGQRLFDDDGQQTPYLKSLLDFLKEFQGQSQRTQAYCKKLKELDLLDSQKIELTFGEEKKTMVGFMAVNRSKLNALPPEKLSELAQSGELELTYLHLISLRNIAQVAGRVAKRRAGQKADAE